MRYNVFLALLVIAFILDLAFLGLSLVTPRARLFAPHQALAAPQPTKAAPAPTAVPTATASPTSFPPTATPPPAPTAMPTATASPTAVPTPPPTATAAPEPRLLASESVSFAPADKAVRANIQLALSHYSGALTHVVLAPGQVFSFNAALGLRPQRLPWKNVRIKPSAPPPSADGTAAPAPEAQVVQGGGVCDLASRYVMAARPLLPARAFKFVNHVRSNGVRIKGVPERDSVSIWAVGGGRGEHDLKITNTTDGWVEWVVEQQGPTVTVTARLWDRAPPGW
jgi:hypothetical protein